MSNHCCVLFTLFLVANALAQDPAAIELPDRLPIRVLQHDDHPAQLWAGGRTYKAGFHGGMTFVPFLGDDYAHNQPFGWRTTSVRLGERELLQPGRPARLSYGDFRAEYDLGVVVEAYDVLTTGLEQTFVFVQRPAGAGELVIRGSLATGLLATSGDAAHHALVFADTAGRPIVAYGAVTAIDALGNRFAMASQCTGAEIVLTLAAADVAAAQFPLVVDPLVARALNNTLQVTATVAAADVAVAGAGNTKRVLLAFAYAVSAADHDIWLQATGNAFNGSAAIFIDQSTENSELVRCAFVAGTSRWVAAWQALDAFGTCRVRAHVHTVDDDAQNNVTRSILNVAGVHDWRPDVGGTMAGSTPHALVVFQRATTGGAFADTATSTVMAARFDTTSTYGQWSAPIQVSSVGNYDAERPSVSQQAEGGSSFAWLCVGQEYNNGIAGDDWDLVGRRIDAAGTVLAGTWISDFATGAPARHQLGPVVAGSDGRHAVLFTTCTTAVGKTSSELGTEIWLECLDWSLASASPNAGGNRAPELLHSNTNRVFAANGLAFDGNTRSHWASAWRSHAPAPGNAYVARCGYEGGLLEGPLTAFVAGAESIGGIGATFDAFQGRFRLHYELDGPTSFRIYGQFLDHPLVTPASNAGPNCSIGTLEWAGAAQGAHAGFNQLMGSRDVGPRVQGFGANDLHFCVVSLAIADLPVLVPAVGSGCRQLVSSGAGMIGTLPMAIGASSMWPVTLPSDLVGLTLHLQDWVFAPASGQITATDRLTVPLVR